MAAPTEKVQESAEWIYKPIMSAWIVFNDGNKCKFYSYELRKSLEQIKHNRSEAVIDFDYGYQALWRLIEEKYKGQHTEARIYGHVNNDDDEGKLLREYKYGILQKPYKDPDFSEEKWVKKAQSMAKEITDNVRRHKRIAHVSNKKRIIQ